MSEFINKAKIVDLQYANAELLNEISNLKIEIEDLNTEIKRLSGENPTDINHLQEKIFAYEQRETELNERLLSLSEEVKNNPRKYDVVKGLLSVFQVMEAGDVETAINNYYKNKWRPKVITSFLFGMLITIISWIIFVYLGSYKHYNEIIEQFINNIL